MTRQHDIAIPMVFPSYLISTSVGKLPYLGHAGILIGRGRDGLTKYYEYGRYDSENIGLTRQKRIPNLTIDENGAPTPDSLQRCLLSVSVQAGKNTEISGSFIYTLAGFERIRTYCEGRIEENSNAKRTPYSIWTNNCADFFLAALRSANVRIPLIIDPRPVSVIEVLRSKYTKIDFKPKNKTLTFQ